MADLSATRASICDSFLENWDKLIAPVNMVKGQYRGYISDFTTGLSNVVDWLEPASALADLFSQVNYSVPGSGLSDMEEIWDIMKNCLFYEGGNPVSSIYDTRNAVYRVIDATVDKLGLGYDQFGPAKWASKINDLLFGLGIPGGQTISNLLKKADYLLDCIVSQCGGYNDPRYLPAQYLLRADEFRLELDDLYDDLMIESNPASSNYGKFKIDEIYDTLSISPAHRGNMNSVIQGIDNVKQGVLDSINSSVSAAKQATRLGSIFV